jgi:hypothetical protein
MRNLFPLLLVLVTSMAPAEEFKGWTILKGTVPQTELRVQPLDALKNIKLTFSLSKRGRRLDGADDCHWHELGERARRKSKSGSSL